MDGITNIQCYRDTSLIKNLLSSSLAYKTVYFFFFFLYIVNMKNFRIYKALGVLSIFSGFAPDKSS